MKKAILSIFAFVCLSVCALFSQNTAADNTLVENVLMDAVSKLATDPRTAVRELEYLDKKFTPNDAVKYYLGIIAGSAGQMDKAEAYLKAALQLDPDNVWYQDALAGLYANMGKTEESADLFLNLLEKYPARYSNAYTFTLLGDRYNSERKDSLAIESYGKALAFDPDYIPAVIGRAEAYRMRGNYPAFMADIHTFVKSPDVKPSAKCGYLTQLLKYVDYRFYRAWSAQLDTLVNTCVTMHPKDSSALLLAGQWYYSTDRKGEGRDYFDRILEYYPKDLKAHYLRLSLLMDGGNMSEVLDECNEIVAIGGEKNPEVIPALSTAGDCWHALGNDRKAMKLYDKVLRMDPENAMTLNNYAYYLSLSGKKLKKAEKMSRTALEMEPENPSFLDTYGWILHLLGRDAEAKPHFKKAIVYGGKDHLEILEHYSVVLDALGEADLARYYKSLAENKKAENR